MTARRADDGSGAAPPRPPTGAGAGGPGPTPLPALLAGAGSGARYEPGLPGLAPGGGGDERRNSEELFRALVQYSADAVVVHDTAGRVTYASPGFNRLFGWPPERLATEGWQAFVLPEDHGAILEALAALDGRGPDEPYTGLFRVRHGDGGMRWAETTSVNHLDTPAVRGIVTNARDVTPRIDGERALRASEARFRTVVSGAYDVTALIGGDGTVLWVTPNCQRLLGLPPEEIQGRNGIDWVHPDNVGEMVEALATFASGDGIPNPAPIRMRHADGTWRDVEVVATDFLRHPDIGGIAVNLRDITERVAVEQERARLTEIFAMTSDHVSTYDMNGRLVYVNDAARRFLGHRPDTPPEDIDVQAHLTPSAREIITREVMDAIAAHQTWSGELEIIDARGAVVPMHAQLHGHRDREGRVEHVSAILRDISERKTFERRLRHEATHDPLTSLPNRALLLDRLGTALERSRRQTTGVALLFCDLDHFKGVNDSLGHSRGDGVLIEVARRLQAQIRPGDTVARFGGDEFVILGEGCRSLDDAIAIATRVDDAMRQPFDLDGRQLNVGVSIGISLAAVPDTPQHHDPESLIRDADAAMYRAKERGRGRFHVFEPEPVERTADRFDLHRALRRALARGELDVVYQPVVALGAAGHPVVGAEALLRWDHPQRGRLLPGEFLGLADDDGVAHDLGAWVLETACRQVRAWLPLLDDPQRFSLSVNLSGRQLEHPDVAAVVAGALRAADLDPGRLDLEVAEHVLMRDAGTSAAALAGLKDLGVNLAVDDFGSGPSSLAHLRRFPVDRLKIDRSVVGGLGAEPADAAVVGAIVGLAHSLGLVAVGEGVETPAQARCLAGVGCDRGQGYLFGGPMTGADLARRLVGGPSVGGVGVGGVSGPAGCTRAASGPRSGVRPGGA